jgi:hypothetical protein
MLKVKREDLPAPAQLDSDYRLRLALQRRALAYDQAGLCTYATLELWNAKLMRSLMAVPPSGYSKVNVEQLIRADMALFRLAQERSRAGIKARPDGTLPLDAIITALATDPEVTFYLLPLPVGAAHRTSSAPQHAAAPSGATQPTRSALKRQHQREAWQKKPAPVPRAEPPGKGKGKGKGTPPAALKGALMALPDGGRICWGFNLNTCAESAAPDIAHGNRLACHRGAHVCARCGKGGHTFADCRS